MMTELAVLLSGEETGALTIEKKGLLTEFSAWSRDPGRLIRLSVYGGGREGYLGVMLPENGRLTLKKRLSRAAMTLFPETPEFAAEAGMSPAPAAEEPESRPEPVFPAEDAAGTEEQPADPDPPPVRARERDTDILWYQAGDGSLYTTWNDHQYRAIPMAAWGLPMERVLERRIIEGVEYAVFAVEDGKII